MLSSFRKFAKTKIAGVFVGIIILPFVFWGMGSMFSSGNVNNLAKINDTNLTTKEFIDYVNQSNIPDNTIRENLENNIIEELLSTLISTTLLELEIENFNIIISENTIFKKIKSNKNFLDEDGNFQRIKYEKFLLENNQSAVGFELRLRGRELQKNLFDYIGAGMVLPKFLANSIYMEENSILNIEFIDLKNFYKKEFTDKELLTFINDNKDDLQVEYVDFDYAIINPKNLIGVDDFNQAYFDKIDQIEIDISNNIDFNSIVDNYGLKAVNIPNFKISKDNNEIEKRIYEVRNIEYDLIENKDDFIIYKIRKLEKKSPNINDNQLKDEITQLISQKNKYEFNKDLINKIQNNEFKENDFLKMGGNAIQKTSINSIKDNKKFEINSVELLYSLPLNSFTLITDDKDNIFLAKIANVKKNDLDLKNDELKQFITKENSKNKTNILKSYDVLLNEKYKVVLNQKTIERVKNFFK